jgi:DNA helicase-2/ATP-dependent DNA helicase PcrA
MKDALFNDKYKALNKEQKLAVDTIEGPVMVIAGPGTGKTTILTLRIANILKETDTPASGILALTFTDSGVKSMKKQVYAKPLTAAHFFWMRSVNSLSVFKQNF